MVPGFNAKNKHYGIRMQVKRRKLKTIFTITIKVIEDSKKAKANQRMFKSI